MQNKKQTLWTYRSAEGMGFINALEKGVINISVHGILTFKNKWHFMVHTHPNKKRLFTVSEVGSGATIFQGGFSTIEKTVQETKTLIETKENVLDESISRSIKYHNNGISLLCANLSLTPITLIPLL